MPNSPGLTPRRFAIALAAVALLLQLGLVVYMSRPGPEKEAGDAVRIPPFAIAHLENPGAILTDRDTEKGHAVVLNFFASWCGPCAVEHPLLMDLAKTAPVIGIDHMDRSSDATRYLARLGNPYAAVGTDTDGKVLADFGFDSIPTTLILNGDGNVLYVHRGRLRESDIDDAIRPLLSKVAP